MDEQDTHGRGNQMTREEILKLAKAHFADPDGSLEILIPELTSFYRAAFSAGQVEMRERQVLLLRRNAHTFAHYLIDEAKALPIGENE